MINVGPLVGLAKSIGWVAFSHPEIKREASHKVVFIDVTDFQLFVSKIWGATWIFFSYATFLFYFNNIISAIASFCVFNPSFCYKLFKIRHFRATWAYAHGWFTWVIDMILYLSSINQFSFISVKHFSFTCFIFLFCYVLNIFNKLLFHLKIFFKVVLFNEKREFFSIWIV